MPCRDPVRVACDLLASLSLALIAVALAWFCWGTLAQSWSHERQVGVDPADADGRSRRAIWWVGIFWFACMAVLLPIQADAAPAGAATRPASTP